MESSIKLFTSIGVMTTVFFIYITVVFVIIPKIKNIMKRQSKIRFLCEHEYVQTFRWESPVRYEYSLQCRKCGKRKQVIIYKEKEE